MLPNPATNKIANKQRSSLGFITCLPVRNEDLSSILQAILDELLYHLEDLRNAACSQKGTSIRSAKSI